ncbi:Organic cation transporter 1 [Nymphon striatum]|nr:Organic cation transporter 1 [Nymphon striatum]
MHSCKFYIPMVGVLHSELENSYTHHIHFFFEHSAEYEQEIDTPSTSNSKATFLDLFRTPNMRKITFLVPLCWAGTSCLTLGLTYLSAELSSNFYFSISMGGIAEFSGCLLLCLLLERLGRRGFSISVLFITAISLISILIIPSAPPYALNKTFRFLFPDYEMMKLALVMCGRAMASGAFHTAFLYHTELFPTVVRAQGIGLRFAVGNSGAMLAPMIAALHSKNEFLPLVIFGIISIVTCVLYIFLPETGGKELPQTLEDGENLGKGQKLVSCFSSKNRVWENYEIASGLNEKELKLRTATFLTCVGPEALDVYDGFAFDSDADKQNIDKIIQKFEIFCVGKTNETFERYNFNMCKQNENDKFDAYVSKLRKLANTCNYGTLQDSLIRDRIVCGITDNTCRKRLLQEETLTLEKCINICRAVESTSLRLKSMTGDLNTNDIQAEIQVIHNKAKQVGKLGCKYCGMNCVRGKCPAFGKKCNECGKLNHFASQCKQKLYKARNQNVKQLSTHSEYLSLSEEEVMSVTSIEVANKIHAKMRLSEENKIVKFQLDSGATANLIPKSLVKHSTIEKANSILTMYNDTKLKSCGTSMIKMTNPKTNKRYRVKFIIINEEFTPILGAKAIQVMNLIEVKYENILKCVNIPNTWTEQDIRSEYADVFEGEGTFHTPLKLEIDEAVSPVKSPLRRIPIALKPELRKELDRLQQMRIIQPVDTPTDWVSSLVIVKKPSGKIRLCIDPKPLNKALKRCHYPLPIIEDLLPELSRAKVFSKCDVKNGFWHVKLTEKSSYLTTFETPFGRYRWLKMPFDTLSRNYITPSMKDHNNNSQDEIFRITSNIEMEIEQINMTDYLAISDEKKCLISKATKEDSSLTQLKKMIERGWNKNDIPEDLKPYFHIRDELSIQDGIIFKGDRCIIPLSIRKEVKEKIHTHTGIEGCLKRARECVYWPRMNAELRDYISKCDICQTYGTRQTKEPLKSHETPDCPWMKVGTDLFSSAGNDYLITSSLLRPNIPENVKERIDNNKARQAHYYNMNAKDLPGLKRGDVVRIEPRSVHLGENLWEKGRISNKHSSRSYEIEKETGSTIRRNRKYIRKTNEKFEPQKVQESVELGEPAELMSHEEQNESTIAETGNVACPDVQSQPTTIVTRLGRHIKQPRWMGDYV